MTGLWTLGPVSDRWMWLQKRQWGDPPSPCPFRIRPIAMVVVCFGAEDIWIEVNKNRKSVIWGELPLLNRLYFGCRVGAFFSKSVHFNSFPENRFFFQVQVSSVPTFGKIGRQNQPNGMEFQFLKESIFNVILLQRSACPNKDRHDESLAWFVWHLSVFYPSSGPAMAVYWSADQNANTHNLYGWQQHIPLH